MNAILLSMLPFFVSGVWVYLAIAGMLYFQSKQWVLAYNLGDGAREIVADSLPFNHPHFKENWQELAQSNIARYADYVAYCSSQSCSDGDEKKFNMQLLWLQHFVRTDNSIYFPVDSAAFAIPTLAFSIPVGLALPLNPNSSLLLLTCAFVVLYNAVLFTVKVKSWARLRQEVFQSIHDMSTSRRWTDRLSFRGCLSFRLTDSRRRM